MNRVTVWHDGGCPLCRREIALMRRPDTRGVIAALRDHVSFYAGPLDRCTVDGEQVRPQPDRFYGGRNTSDLAGPFKGVPGSMGW